jgi:hypothetical protein
LIDLSLPDKSLLDSVVFYSNDGSVQEKIPIKLENKEVVLFDFLEEEALLLMFSDGFFNLFEPGKKKHTESRI